MSLKREEIAIEDEPPGLEAVGTATLHLQDGLQPRLQRGGILRSGADNLGGVLAAKVSDFGSNLLKCTRGQMGTKPAKVGHPAPGAI